jgi:hypothetical protein
MSSYHQFVIRTYGRTLNIVQHVAVCHIVSRASAAKSPNVHVRPIPFRKKRIA